MIQTLKNDLLTVEIDSHGAELQSITANRTNYQYLWQGDKKFWGRRSPVLFPIVGSVWNGCYRMDDNEYTLSQHGFARDCDFEILTDKDDDEAWFALEYNEHTFMLFPRRFRLEIGYRLREERITVMWNVVNLDEKIMPFQIGAHPAFNLPGFSVADPIHGYFMFNSRDLVSGRIEEKGCIGKEMFKIGLDDNGILPITASTFSHDALILADAQVNRVSILDKAHMPYMSLLFNSPLVGLWSPSPEAPFVCIEPWWGRCDRIGYDGDFASRDYVNLLEPRQTFHTSYMIIIEDV